ncbi:MAG: OstA-like protein [Salinivenus sp.]
MSSFDVLSCSPPRWLLGALILGTLLGGLGQPAVGQVAEDSTAAGAEAPRPAPLDTVRAQDVGPPDTSDTERVLVNADSLSALSRDGQRIQELFDNVQVQQDTTELRSDYGLRYLNQDELLFTGDVVIYERGDTLRADTVRYNKRTKVGYARSDVRLTDGEVVVRAPRATYYTDEQRSVFPDSVTLVDSTRVLRAQSGTYWSDDRRAEFQGEVRLTDPETYLEADSLTYYRDRERSIAVGNVFIRRAETETEPPRDTTSRTYLFGDWVDNQEQKRFSEARGRALLMRVRLDSAGAPEDTLVVRGERLEAYRTDRYRRLIAVDSVRIWQSDLAAVADSAVYDRVVATGATDTLETPRPLPDTMRSPPPDSARRRGPPSDSLSGVPIPGTLAGIDALGSAQRSPADSGRADSAQAPRPAAVPARPDTSARPSATRPSRTARDSTRGAGASSWGLPTARREEQVPLEESRLFRGPVTWFEQSQVWGDSIRVRSQNRSLDTVFVRGAAFAAQRDSALDRIQQLKARNLTAFFRRDSLRRIVARPNAQAIRFLATERDSLRGGARASGDRIVLRFRDGAMKRTTIEGGVQSNYYRSPETIPDPFELEGFQWTPDRKPTKAGLLRTPRVRERLDLRPGPTRPPLARRAGARPPADGPPADSSVARDTPYRRGERAPPGPASGSTLPVPLAPNDLPYVPVDSTRGYGFAVPPADSSQTRPPRP